MPNEDKPKWFWATSEDSESYDGPYDSKEDAIAEARGTLDGDSGDHFYVGIGVPVDAGDVMADCFNLDWSLENVAEAAYDSDQAGEWIEDWFPATVPDEAEAEFKEFIKGWARKHFPVRYYVVGSAGLEEVLLDD